MQKSLPLIRPWSENPISTSVGKPRGPFVTLTAKSMVCSVQFGRQDNRMKVSKIFIIQLIKIKKNFASKLVQPKKTTNHPSPRKWRTDNRPVVAPLKGESTPGRRQARRDKTACCRIVIYFNYFKHGRPNESTFTHAQNTRRQYTKCIIYACIWYSVKTICAICSNSNLIDLGVG